MFGGKIVPDENFARFFLESPQNRFSEKENVFSSNSDYVACLGEKLFPTKTSLVFSSKAPKNRFSEKENVFGLNFYMKPPPYQFQGVTDCVARLGAKLFRTKTSLAFTHRKSFFQIKRLLAECFYETTP
jgi:hypothetical protein